MRNLILFSPWAGCLNTGLCWLSRFDLLVPHNSHFLTLQLQRSHFIRFSIPALELNHLISWHYNLDFLLITIQNLIHLPNIKFSNFTSPLLNLSYYCLLLLIDINKHFFVHHNVHALTLQFKFHSHFLSSALFWHLFDGVDKLNDSAVVHFSLKGGHCSQLLQQFECAVVVNLIRTWFVLLLEFFFHLQVLEFEASNPLHWLHHLFLNSFVPAIVHLELFLEHGLIRKYQIIKPLTFYVNKSFVLVELK